MANGIEFCSGCKHSKPFEKSQSEPAFFKIRYSGLFRAMLRNAGVTNNRVDVMDEDQVVRTTMVVPEDALDEPGAIKEATQACRVPMDRVCGAEVLLQMKFNQQEA